MIKLNPTKVQNIEKSIQKQQIKSKSITNCDFSCEEKGFFMVHGKPVKIIFPR